MGMSCTAVMPSADEVGNLAGHIQERAAPSGHVRREVGADVELVDHEVLKLRRDEAGLVPGEIGGPDDAVAGERRDQFAREGIALGTLAAIADDVEQVAVLVADAGDEAAPVALVVPVEQAGIGPLAIVELADHVHGMGVGRPDAESGAIGNQIRTHGRVGLDVLQRGWHGRSILQGESAQ